MEGKIGLFVNGRSGYHGEVIRGVEAEAQREGLSVEVFDANGSVMRQAQDLARYAFSNEGTRACALYVPVTDRTDADDAAGTDPVLSQAQRVLQKGVGFVLLNHGREATVRRLAEQYPRLPVGMVAVDNLEFGRLQGRQLQVLVPAGGTVLCVRGHSFDTASTDRTRGLHQVLDGLPYEVEEIDAHWRIEMAEEAVQQWITSPLRRRSALHAVVAQNDHMGKGARHGLVRAAAELSRPDLAHLPVLGGDGLPDYGLSWLRDGLLTSTVVVTLPGPAAVRALAAHWRDGAAFPLVSHLPVVSEPSLERLGSRAGAGAMAAGRTP